MRDRTNTTYSAYRFGAYKPWNPRRLPVSSTSTLPQPTSAELLIWARRTVRDCGRQILREVWGRFGPGAESDTSAAGLPRVSRSHRGSCLLPGFGSDDPSGRTETVAYAIVRWAEQRLIPARWMRQSTAF